MILAGHQPTNEAARHAQRDYLARLCGRALELPDQVIVIGQPLGHAEMFSLMRASELAISVPQADQRSSSVLEAAAAGCRLLLSDIAPYRELVADGLRAHLLPDPLDTTLTRALTLAEQLTSTDRQANRQLISETERGSAKLTQMEWLYQSLAGPARPCA